MVISALGLCFCFRLASLFKLERCLPDDDVLDVDADGGVVLSIPVVSEAASERVALCNHCQRVSPRRRRVGQRVLDVQQ